jgi:hypothetical protein
MTDAIANMSTMRKVEETREPCVVLRLSTDAANVLMVILAHVTGDPVNSPRKHADSIEDALEKTLGYPMDYLREHSLLIEGSTTVEKSIVFRNYDGTTPPALQRLLDKEEGTSNGSDTNSRNPLLEWIESLDH